MTDQAVPPGTATTYADDDLVYVDPEKRVAVGRVEFAKNGNAKTLEWKSTVAPVERDDEDPKRRRRPRVRYYPWGTYRSMKKLYRLEGKEKEADRTKTFDEALELALQQPFWD